MKPSMKRLGRPKVKEQKFRRRNDRSHFVPPGSPRCTMQEPVEDFLLHEPEKSQQGTMKKLVKRSFGRGVGIINLQYEKKKRRASRQEGEVALIEILRR
jgi:hypothetical protein